MWRSVYCARCRRRVDRETYNFWQGTAWCSQCCNVVTGTPCKVPCWVIGTVVLLVLRIQIQA